MPRRSSPFATDTPLKITDTTLRDGHQSSLATRMRTEDMLPIAEALDEAGFHSLEVWGGATFDVATRFLAEDPWDRVRALKQRIKKTPLQMLLRGQNLVGYRNYADDVVRAFVLESAEVGIDIFRVFDAVNDERNFEAPFKAIKETGKHIQGTLCYSVTQRRLGGPVYNIDYFVKKAKVLQEMGIDSLCIKDMAGLMAPYDAYELIKALKAVITVPIQLHTHYTSGMAAMACLKAAEAGVDIIDCALAPFALRSSQPAVEPLVATLTGTPRDTGLNLDRLLKLGEYFESIAPKYRDYLDTSRFSVIDTGVLVHQIPGGMYSNLIAQLREAEALDRLSEVYQELPRTRKDLGYPPLVTPTSQIVGVQAVQNVLFGRYQMVSGEVKDYIYGLYGRPPAPIDPEVQRKVLKGYERGEEPITVRPADTLPPELPAAKEAIKDITKNRSDELIYALYPTTGLRFLRWKYGLEPVPQELKPKTIEDVRRQDELIAKAKAGLLQEKPSGEAPAKGPGLRTFNVYIGSDYFKVEVEPADGAAPQPLQSPVPRAAAASGGTPPSAPARTASPSGSAPATSSPSAAAPKTAVAEGDATIVAPMPGLVISYAVEVGTKVKAGDPVVVLEAMKMQNSLPSPVDGVVNQLPCQPGTRVSKNDLLAVISTKG